VVVRANQPALLPLLVQNLGPDQTVVLRGLEVVGRPVSAGFAPAAMAVVGAIEGSVRFEDCRLRSEQTELNQWGLLAQDCADLTLVRTSIEGSGYDVAAVQLFNTHAHFFETDVRGAHGAAAFIPEVHGGAAVVVEGGSLVASGGSFRGGDGGTPVDFGGSCFLETGGNGGHGLQVTSGQVYLSSVALAGGALGNGVAGCPDGAPGAALVDPGALVTVAAEPARGVRSASPAFAGRDTVLALVGQPGEDAFAVVAGAPDALLVPALGGALLVGPPAAVIPAGQVQPWGSTTVLVTVPPLPSGLEAATWHIQAAFLDPVLGTRLGGVTAVTVLAP